MVRKLTLIVIALGALILVSGCYQLRSPIHRATASVMPGTDLNTVKTFYVVQYSGDQRGIERLIRDNLIKRGFTATSGPELPQPPQADAVVTYVDRWQWAFGTYMIELIVTLRNPANNFPLAVGYSWHERIFERNPELPVDEVLTNIFKGPQPGATGGLQ